MREQMTEGMRIRGLGEKSQQAPIRALKDFAVFWGAPDTATAEELRAYRLHMTDAKVSPLVYSARIAALPDAHPAGWFPLHPRHGLLASAKREVNIAKIRSLSGGTVRAIRVVRR